MNYCRIFAAVLILNFINMNANNITVIMYKIIGGVKQIEFKLHAMTDSHAVLVAQSFYNKCGLIGRYYVETETGYKFSIS